jgi:hypothetical protein
MKRFTVNRVTLLLAVFMCVGSLSVAANPPQEDQGQRVSTVSESKDGRHIRAERPRRRGRSIKGSFAESGNSAGRGGKGLGQNIAKGRPVRGGKEFGKGMGGFGKHLGIGVGKTVKRAVTP